MYKVGESWKNQWIINEDLYFKFLNISRDKNPMHTDHDFAKSHGFPEKIVHGNLLNCFLSYFIGEIIPTKNVIIIEQKIRYLKPIFINNKINFVSNVDKYVESVRFVSFKFSFYKNDLEISSGHIHINIV